LPIRRYGFNRSGGRIPIGKTGVAGEKRYMFHKREFSMKKALVLIGVLALVVNMGLSADNLSDGRKYTAMAKDIFGDLSPSRMQYIANQVKDTADTLGKISTAMDSYKYLKGFYDVCIWSARYKDASTDAEKIAAGKAASRSMLRMLDAFVSLAGGPLYGMVLPSLLKAVGQTVDIIHLRNARIQLANWAGDTSEYTAIYGGTGRIRGWDWSGVCGAGYENLAVEIIAKYNGGLKPLAAVVDVIERLEKLRDITQ
jgi:hypothetical protein